jgi:hypothetical protein
MLALFFSFLAFLFFLFHPANQEGLAQDYIEYLLVSRAMRERTNHSGGAHLSTDKNQQDLEQ